MGEVILVASGKGGVGKTVFTANFGAKIAQGGAAVLLVDMNVGTRSLDICLGLENQIVYDLSDVINGTCRIKQALIRDKRFPELLLMSAPQNRDKANFSTEEMSQLCEELARIFDYVILDGSAGINEDLRIAAAPADKAVIVTVPEHTALRDAELLDAVLSSFGIKNKHVVVNKIIPSLFHRGIVPDPAQIAEILRPPIAGLIPYDINIHISANIGVPIVLAKGSYIERNFEGIANRIIFDGKEVHA